MRALFLQSVLSHAMTTTTRPSAAAAATTTTLAFSQCQVQSKAIATTFIVNSLKSWTDNIYVYKIRIKKTK